MRTAAELHQCTFPLAVKHALSSQPPHPPHRTLRPLAANDPQPAPTYQGDCVDHRIDAYVASTQGPGSAHDRTGSSGKDWTMPFAADVAALVTPPHAVV